MKEKALRHTLKKTTLVALGLWVAGFIIFALTTSLMTPSPSAGTLKAAIVLTGGPKRVDTGLDLLHNKKVETVFITGVDRRVSTELLLSLWGEPDTSDLLCCILLEYEARNTVENAYKTYEWMSAHPDINDVYLVTSEYHMPRAWLEFKALLKEKNIHLYPVHSEKMTPRYWGLVFGEYHKTLFAGLHHLWTSFSGNLVEPHSTR